VARKMVSRQKEALFKGLLFVLVAKGGI